LPWHTYTACLTQIEDVENPEAIYFTHCTWVFLKKPKTLAKFKKILRHSPLETVLRLSHQPCIAKRYLSSNLTKSLSQQGLRGGRKTPLHPTSHWYDGAMSMCPRPMCPQTDSFGMFRRMYLLSLWCCVPQTIHLPVVASPGSFIPVSSVLFLDCGFIHDWWFQQYFRHIL
jgi:hypothetical protein